MAVPWLLTGGMRASAIELTISRAQFPCPDVAHPAVVTACPMPFLYLAVICLAFQEPAAIPQAAVAVQNEANGAREIDHFHSRPPPASFLTGGSDEAFTKRANKVHTANKALLPIFR